MKRPVFDFPLVGLVYGSLKSSFTDDVQIEVGKTSPILTASNNLIPTCREHSPTLQVEVSLYSRYPVLTGLDFTTQQNMLLFVCNKALSLMPNSDTFPSGSLTSKRYTL